MRAGDPGLLDLELRPQNFGLDPQRDAILILLLQSFDGRDARVGEMIWVPLDAREETCVFVPAADLVGSGVHRHGVVRGAFEGEPPVGALAEIT